VRVALAVDREVDRELAADRLDAVHEAAREVAAAEALADRRRDVPPELRADALVDAAVAEHDELAARRHDEEQDAVAAGGRRHPEAFERALGVLAHVAPEQRRDGDADLAGGPALGLLDRALHRLGVQGAQQLTAGEDHVVPSSRYHEPVAPPPPERPPPPKKPPSPPPPPPPPRPPDSRLNSR